MIGIHVKNHKIIAAMPINQGESGHMIVVGKSLPKRCGRHSATFVTWFTDGQGVFDSPTYFTDHSEPQSVLMARAMVDMIARSRFVQPSFVLA